MAVNIIQIQRWIKMLLGKSVEHVHQGVGKVYSKSEIKGYYNDLTEKVTMDKSLLYNDKLPLIKQLDGEYIYFPVAIFQYALGCYDLWLIEKKEIYKNKFMQCVSWILDKQDEKGGWDNFSYFYKNAPYGAMAQGEGSSVLLRAYTLTGDVKYRNAAKKAIDFMLQDIKNGGTTEYVDGKVVFHEYTNQPVVLNGWIYAWWGLYDYVICTNDNGQYKHFLNESMNSLIISLPLFKNKYWSLYDYDKKLTSPFYHNLHIAQMKAMFDLTGVEIFKEYATKWQYQQGNIFCKSFAFIIKAIQKIRE